MTTTTKTETATLLSNDRVALRHSMDYPRGTIITFAHDGRWVAQLALGDGTIGSQLTFGSEREAIQVVIARAEQFTGARFRLRLPAHRAPRRRARVAR